MAAKIYWHRSGRKLRHCRPTCSDSVEANGCEQLAQSRQAVSQKPGTFFCLRGSGDLSKVTDFNSPYMHLAPWLGMTPFEFRRDLWHKKLESLGHIVRCRLRDSYVRRFPVHTILRAKTSSVCRVVSMQYRLALHWRTDRQTLDDSNWNSIWNR